MSRDDVGAGMGTALDHGSVGSFAESAAFYLKLSWPVFPLHAIRNFGTPQARCGCGRADCERPGKHPLIPSNQGGHGFKDATLDPEQIDMWDYQEPEANIAMATGDKTGVLVIDIDGERGETSVARLAEAGRLFTPTATVMTGRGRHLYYRHIKRLRCSASQLAPGIDVRADGGQAVLPPSRHISGRVYHWCPSPIEVQPRLAPLWIPRMLRANREAAQRKAYSGYVGDAQMTRDGRRRPPMEVIDGYALRVATLAKDSQMRNTMLNEQAFNAWRDAKRYGLRESEVFDKLMSAAKSCGLPAREAVATIRSAQRGAYQKT